MASVTYGKSIMSSVIMAKILWQMKLSPPLAEILYHFWMSFLKSAKVEFKLTFKVTFKSTFEVEFKSTF